MVKVTNPTSKSAVRSKNDTPHESQSRYVEGYKDLFTLKFKPVKKEFIERLALDLIAWVDAEKLERRLKVSEFFRIKKIPRKTYYRWAEKYEDLKEAHEYAMLTLGDKREIGAIVRDYAEASVFRRMHAYDPDWEADRQRDKQDKIDIAIAVKKAAMEMGDNKPQVIVLSELEFKKKELECKD